MLVRTIAGLIVVTIASGCEPATQEHDTSPTQPEPALPPMPDFSEPVDYVEWYTQRNSSPEAPVADVIYADCVGVSQPEGDLGKQLNRAATGPWSADDMPELAEFLESIAAKLDAYAAAARVRQVRWDLAPMRQEGLLTVPDPLSKMLGTLGSATSAKAWLKTGEADVDPSVLLNSWQINLNCANHLDRRFGILACLRAMGLRSEAYASIRKGIQLGIIDSEDLKEALRLIVADARASIDEAFRAEAASLFDLLQRMYPDGKFSAAAAKKLGQGQYFPAQGLFLPSPEVTAGRAASYLRPILEATAGEMSLAVLQEIDRLEQRKKKIAGSNSILSMYLPRMEFSYRAALYSELERRGTATVVALSMFHHTEGRWPASLNELNGRLSGLMRTDPYSTNEPFFYRVEDGIPQLYSVALDGADNGGKHSKKAHRELGWDYVFLPWAEE